MGAQATSWLLLALAGVVGLFVGSFLNLCICRLPRNCMNVFRGPRGCPGCPRKWEWRERIPVAGWFVNLGRCPACHHQYTTRPPLGVVKYSAMLGSVLGPIDAVYAFVFASVLGMIFGILKTIPGRKLGDVQFGPFQSLGALPLIFWSPETHRYLEGAFSLLFRRHH